MKKAIPVIILLLYSLFIQAQDKPKNGPFEEYYTNGNIKTKGAYKNDKRIGHWKYYYSSGVLKRERTYSQSGEWTGYKRWFSEDNILKGETKPKEDNTILETHYFEDGSMHREFALAPVGKKGYHLKHGIYKEYYRNGMLKVESKYSKSELNGVWKQFYDTGEKEWEVIYVDGYKQGVYIKFYKNGKIQLQGKNVLNKRVGEELQYNEKGEELYKLKFKNGKAKNIAKAPLGLISIPNGIIERVPIFPGCENNIGNRAKKKCMSKKVTEFVAKNFNTSFAKATNLSGVQKINIIFKIDGSGKVKDIRARAKHKSLEAEAIRVVALLPKMIPGFQYGKPVTVPYSLPIIFKM